MIIKFKNFIDYIFHALKDKANHIKLKLEVYILKIKYKLYNLKNSKMIFIIIHSLILIIFILLTENFLPEIIGNDRYNLFINSTKILDGYYLQNLYWMSAIGFITVLTLFFTLKLPTFNSINNKFYYKVNKKIVGDAVDTYVYILICINILFLLTFPFLTIFSEKVILSISLLIIIYIDSIFLMFERYVNSIKKLDKSYIIQYNIEILEKDLEMKRMIFNDIKKITYIKPNESNELDNFFCIGNASSYYSINEKIVSSIKIIDSLMKEAIKTDNYPLFDFGVNKLADYCIKRLKLTGSNVIYNILSQYGTKLSTGDFDNILDFMVISKYKNYMNIALEKKDYEILSIISGCYNKILYQSNGNSYNNYDDYQITVAVFFSEYSNLLKNAINIGFSDLSSSYCNNIYEIFNKYEISKINSLLFSLSESNVGIIKMCNKEQDWFVIQNIINLQNKIIGLLLFNYNDSNDHIVKHYFEDTLKILSSSVLIFLAEKFPKRITLEFILRNFLSEFCNESLTSTIIKIYNQKYSGSLDDKEKSMEFIDILDNFRDFSKNISEVFTVSDPLLNLEYENYIKRILEILEKYLFSSKIQDEYKNKFKERYNEYVNLFCKTIVLLPKKYTNIYEKKDFIFIKYNELLSLKAEDLANGVLDLFLNACNERLKNLGQSREKWDIRVYDNILYIASQTDDKKCKEILDNIELNVRKYYYNSIQTLRVLVDDIDSNINSHDRGFSSHLNDAENIRNNMDQTKIKKIRNAIVEMVDKELDEYKKKNIRELIKMAEEQHLLGAGKMKKEELINFFKIQ